jgi:uncharacterized protein YybS (DUF2232 family)
MKINDVMVCSGFVILFLLASILIPIVGPFLSLIIPLPFLFYSSKLGLQQGVITSVISLAIVSIIAGLAGYPHIIIQCVEFGLLGLIISEVFRRQFSFGMTIFWGILTMLLTAAVLLLVISVSVGKGPIDLILNYFQADLNKAIHFYENMGMNQEQITELQQLSKLFIDLFKKVFPSIIIIWTGCVVWLNVIISKPLFHFKRIRYPNFGPMDKWQAPELLVWGLIASGFALFLPMNGIKWAAVNMLIVMTVIYLFNGLSIILFLFNKYHIPSWARFGIYILLSIQVIFWLILAIVGLFDQWIDFRKIHYKESETN